MEGHMKHIGTTLIAGLSVVLLAVVVQGDDRRGEQEDSRIARGFEISPVQPRITRRNHDSVGLGSYIVNAQGACNDCHTCPSYSIDLVHDRSAVRGGEFGEFPGRRDGLPDARRNVCVAEPYAESRRGQPS